MKRTPGKHKHGVTRHKRKRGVTRRPTGLHGLLMNAWTWCAILAIAAAVVVAWPT